MANDKITISKSAYEAYKKSMASLKQAANAADGIKEGEVDGVDDIKQKMDTNKTGQPISSSIKNVVLVLKNDKHFQNLFRMNNYTKQIEVTRSEAIDLDKESAEPLGLGKIVIDRGDKGEFHDSCVPQIMTYLSAVYDMNPKETLVRGAIQAVALSNKYNPVNEYFDSAYKNWDHKPRMKQFFRDYLGIEQDKVNVLQERLWLMGVVSKVYDPERPVDYVLDLTGSQGVGKTTFLKKLAPSPDYYTDDFTNFDEKDSKTVFRGCLIANDDELQASNASGFDVIKKFVSQQVFQYRPPYGHNVITFPKRFMLARTTNEITHLKDRSGDRRFLCLICSSQRQKKHPQAPHSMMSDEVKQFWGGLVYAYKHAKHDPFDITSDEFKMLEDNRQKFIATNDLEDAVLQLVQNQMFKDMDKITNGEMRSKLDTLLGHRPSSRDLVHVRYIMTHLGYLPGQCWRNGDATARGYVKSNELDH